MSTVIDERIVSIEFDNKHFEQNVGDTLQSLNSLKKSLNFDGAAKGLDGINTATKKIDMSNLSLAIDKVGLKFNWLYSVADQALRNITNSAMAAGKRIVSSLTIQPIKTGLSEYETQLNSVQTILANTESKGSTLQDVNRALDELNRYADKTIYNFTEMTRNIGTFTAAGVDLDTSVSAIKGIANLAAVSGSTSQQASTAMYQLSQALASGTVKLMDWNSVVNAGMGGQVFQDALKETAKVHGIAIDQIIKDQGSFRESLKEGWLSSEILTETLAKFTGDLNEEQLKSKGYTAEQIKEIMKLGKTANDAATKVKTFSQLLDTMKESAQSGWAQTWEIVIGDFGEAKNLWTNVSNAMGKIIGGAADARNELLGGAFSTGWKQLLGEGIMDEEGYIHHIKEVAKARQLDMDALIDDEHSFEDVLKSCLKSGLITSDMLSEALGNLTGDIGAMSDEYLKNMGYTNEQVEALKKLNQEIQNGDISMSEYVKKIKRMSGRELLINAEYDEKGMLIVNERTGALVKLFKLLGDVIKPIKEAFREIFPPATSDQLYSLLKGFQKFTTNLKVTKDTADKIKRAFKGLFAVVDIGVMIAKTAWDILTGVLKTLSPLSGGILDVAASLGDFLVGLRDSIKEGTTLANFVDWTVWAFGSLVKVIQNFFKVLKGQFKKPAWLDSFVNGLKKVWNVTKTIFVKMGEFISSFMKKVREYITQNITMDEMKEGFSLLAAGGITAMVMSILSLIKKVIKKFKKFDFKDIFEPFNNVLGELQKTLQTFQQKIKAEALMTIAKALVMLVASVIVLSFVDTDKVIMAITSIGLLLGMLVGALALINGMSEKVTKVRAMEKFGTTFKKFTNVKEMIISSGRDTAKTIKNVSALTGLAISVFFLALAMKKVSELSWSEIGRGLVAVAGCLTLMLAATLALNAISGLANKMGVQRAKSGPLFKLSMTLLMLAGILKLLGMLSWGEMGRGLIAMNVALGTYVGTFAILSVLQKYCDNPRYGRAVRAMSKMTRVLAVLATTLAILGLMSWGQISRGLVAMTGSLGTLVGLIALLNVISKIEGGAHKGVGRILALTGAFAIIGLTLKLLSTIPWKKIKQGLAAMTITLGTLTGIVGVLALLSKVDSKGSGTLQVLGLTVGLLMIAGVLGILSTMDWSTIKQGLIAMTVSLGVLVGALALLAVISKLSSGGTLAAAAASLVIMSAAIMTLVPSIALLGSMQTETLVKGLLAMGIALGAFVGVAFALQTVAPGLIAVAGALALFGVACLAVGAGIAALSIGLSTLLNSLIAVVSFGVAAIVGALQAIIGGIAEMLPLIFTMIAEAIVAFCSIISKGAPAIGEAIVAVILAVFDILVTVVPQLAESLFKIILGVLEALVQYLPDIVDKLFTIILTIVNKIGDFIPDLVQSVVNLFMKFFEGLVTALQGIDYEMLAEGLLCMGAIAGLMAALSAVSALIPGAMIGVVGMGLVIAELALVLAAIGALARIPGLVDIINDGGALLTAVGTAIGQFIGGILGGIAQGFTSSLPKIGTDLSNFMINLQPFLDGIERLDANVLNNAKNLAGVILMITAADIIQGLTSWFTGGSSMAKFGVELAAFGKGIKDFADETSGIDPATVTAAAEAGKNLGIMAKNIPTSGGLWDLIAGKNDLKGFADQLVYFGQGVKNFANQVRGINGETVKLAAEAGVQLGKMAKEIPTSGGLWELIAGKKDLKGFGNQLSSFAEGVKNFARQVSGVNFDNVPAAVDAGKKIGKMAKEIPTSGGLWDKITGKSDLKEFGSQLKSFGSAIKDFIGSVNGVGNAGKAISTVEDLNSTLKSFSTKGIDGMVSSLKKGKTKVGDAMKGLIESAIKSITDKTSDFVDAGKKFISKFIEGIKSYSTKVKNAFLELVTTAIGSMKTEDYYNKFFSVGKYFVQGFAAGINDNTYLASAKAKAMANAAATAAKEALDEHSPSKVGYEIGDYFGIAFVDAIDTYGDKAYSAGYSMASSAKIGLQKAVSKISSLIENGIDSNPVITPVLNLDNLATGAGVINDMFSMSPTVGTLAKANIINSTINNQNRGNDDVITAINSLNKTMKDASNDKLSIGNINVESGSELEQAMQTIIRYAKMERRM